ncbi:MAG: pantetheine-phosphate adenylyltransferase [Candidatus Levyibacteriota bacterium]
MAYHLVAAGGTFDRLHQGHKDFLNFIVSLGEKVVLGLTSDTYINAYKGGLGVEAYDIRLHALEAFLKSTGRAEDIEIVSLDDHFGPTLNPAYKFDSLAVTTATEEAGRGVNKKRVEEGMPELPLEIFQLTLAEDGEPITSTRIRNGEINRAGRIFVKQEWLESTFLLPSTLRKKLQDIWGEIITEPPRINSKKLITVGDRTTKTFLDAEIFPQLAIIDNKVERKEIPEGEFPPSEKIKVVNTAGNVSSELTKAIRKVLRQSSQAFFPGERGPRVVIIVEGEEDLAVLPALLCAPLGFTIFYGQPGAGMVRLEVTEEIKDEAYELMSRFEKKT